MMDPDGVYQGANTTVLHWLRTNNTISSASSPGTGIYPLGNSTMQDASDLAPYYPPSPPFEVPAHAHHYTLLLFEQADEKDVVITEQLNQSLTYRVGFNLSDFVDNSGIGPLVAAKYFTLINTTSTANTSSGASGARLTASVTPLFTSAASPVNVLRPGHYVGIGVLSFLWRACLG